MESNAFAFAVTASGRNSVHGPGGQIELEYFSPVGRHGLQYCLAVAPIDDTFIKECDLAPVFLAAQQTTAGLHQSKCSVRNRQSHECVHTLLLDPLRQRHFDGIVRHREGNFCNQHMGAIFAGQIYTLGEAGQAKY